MLNLNVDLECFIGLNNRGEHKKMRIKNLTHTAISLAFLYPSLCPAGGLFSKII